MYQYELADWTVQTGIVGVRGENTNHEKKKNMSQCHSTKNENLITRLLLKTWCWVPLQFTKSIYVYNCINCVLHSKVVVKEDADIAIAKGGIPLHHGCLESSNKLHDYWGDEACQMLLQGFLRACHRASENDGEISCSSSLKCLVDELETNDVHNIHKQPYLLPRGHTFGCAARGSKAFSRLYQRRI